MNSNQENTSKTQIAISSNTFVCVVAIFPVLLAALLSTIIHASIPFSYVDADTDFATVSSPPHNSTVHGTYIASGTIKRLQPNRLLYVAEESEGKYYPKEKIKNAPSTWTQSLYAGGPAGTQFRLVVLSVDDKDDQTIRNWFKTGESSGRYPGLSNLGSVEELSAIKLVIK